MTTRPEKRGWEVSGAADLFPNTRFIMMLNLRISGIFCIWRFGKAALEVWPGYDVL